MPKGTLLPLDTVVTGDDYVTITDMAGPTTKKITWSNIVVWLKTQLFPVLKADMEKAHYNALFWSTNGASSGQVLQAQTTVNFDTSDTTNGFGITATTGTGAYMTIARDGVYTITIQLHFTDSTNANSVVIPWYSLDFGSGVALIRQNDVVMQGLSGQVVQHAMTAWLPAGTKVGLQGYASSNTRFGAPSTGSSLTAYQAQRIFGTHIAVLEVR